MPLFYARDAFELDDTFLVLPFNRVTWLQSEVEAAIVLLTQEGNWQQTGSITAKTMAEVMSGAYEDRFYMPDPTGSIIAYALAPADLPIGCLYCDGSLYATTDYPVLFGKVGYTFGGSGASFSVPDLRGRTVVGVGTGSGLSPRALAASFGEENHTLNQSEIPSHSHTVPATIDGLAVAPGELPVLTPVPLVDANTGSTGGSGSHNNMQPSFALTYAIVTGQ